MTTSMFSTADRLATLNSYRAAEGKAPFADWRNARHMPMLEAYILAEAGMELEGDEPDALIVLENGETVRESEIEVEVVEAPVAKLPAYKVLARQSGTTSAIENPVAFVHEFCSANPDMKRKEAVASLVGQGVNYSTARTQYQKWFTANKAAK